MESKTCAESRLGGKKRTSRFRICFVHSLQHSVQHSNTCSRLQKKKQKEPPQPRASSSKPNRAALVRLREPVRARTSSPARSDWRANRRVRPSERHYAHTGVCVCVFSVLNFARAKRAFGPVRIGGRGLSRASLIVAVVWTWKSHLRRIGGWRRMTASYSLVHVIPASGERRRGVMRHVRWELPRHLLSVSRRLSVPLSWPPRRVALWCFPPRHQPLTPLKAATAAATRTDE